MKKANRYFLAGVLFSLVAGVVMVRIATLQAYTDMSDLKRHPREIRLGFGLGLLVQNELRESILGSTISRGGFATRLFRMLRLLGAPLEGDVRSLQVTGVMKVDPWNGPMTRQAAVESLSQALVLVAQAGMITLPEARKVSFRDYKPASKLHSQIVYLRENDILRGYPDGSFRPSSRITVRESVSLLFRLYETISQGRMEKSADSGLLFVDLPKCHPILADLEILEEGGAFSYITLGASFDGYSSVTLRDLIDVARGILDARGSLKSSGDEIKSFIGTSRDHLPVKRGQLVMVMDYLMGRESSISGSEFESYYRDLRAGTQEHRSAHNLLSAGIQLGYPGGYLRPSEMVTWYEIVGSLKHTISNNAPQRNGRVELDHPAERADFERFAATIQAKRAHLRRILRAPGTPKSR